MTERPGRVLTHDEAMALGQRLLAMVRGHSLGIWLEHTARTMTKLVNGRVVACDDGDELAIRFTSQFGSGLPVFIGTNQLNDQLLRRVVERALRAAPPSAPSKEDIHNPDHPIRYSYNARTYLPVSLWHESTIDAMHTARGTVVPALARQLQTSGVTGAATVGVVARATLYLFEPGRTAWCHETDAEVSVTARTPDGTASGWAGQASRDWTRIDPAAIATQAIHLAEQGRTPVALEPGFRTAILGPAAVAQLIRLMEPLFDRNATEQGQTPFSMPPESDLPTRMGQRVIDARLTMVSDPADPDGGFAPFFEGESSSAGLPVPATTWIENGVLTNLAYHPIIAVARGRPWSKLPTSVRLTPVPNTPTMTLEEMIANCADGIYVNRFSNVSLVDMKTGLMRGVTRDGCFHVQQGKVVRPVKNFQFLESPNFLLNKVVAVGTPQRAPFGYTPPTPNEFRLVSSWPPLGGARWPCVPVIVPPLMVEDFNFSALSDAV